MKEGIKLIVFLAQKSRHIVRNGLTDLANRDRPIPVVDATLAHSYSFEGAGGLAPQPFWPFAASTG